MENNLLHYSMELAMLTTLLNDKLITSEEFDKLKIELMNDYQILSDIVAKVS